MQMMIERKKSIAAAINLLKGVVNEGGTWLLGCKISWMECLCRNECPPFVGEIKKRDAHIATCINHYFVKCPTCGSENNLGDYL